MAFESAKIRDIPTQIKDKKLVARRRRQIVDAAVELFMEKGFHKTTTRQIAGTAGISIGLLYEYIATKEDILYLVCEAIHAEIHAAVIQGLNRMKAGAHPLSEAIGNYFLVCHRMSDHIVLIYQEIHSLPARQRRKVLQNEEKITALFIEVLEKLMAQNALPALDQGERVLAAHNICVLGHMWAFRRWRLATRYTIDEYTRIQTGFILSRYRKQQKRGRNIRNGFSTIQNPERSPESCT